MTPQEPGKLGRLATVAKHGKEHIARDGRGVADPACRAIPRGIDEAPDS